MSEKEHKRNTAVKHPHSDRSKLWRGLLGEECSNRLITEAHKLRGDPSQEAERLTVHAKLLSVEDLLRDRGAF